MKRLLVILIVAALAVAAFSGCSFFQKTEMNTTSPNVLIHSDGTYTIYLPACDQEVSVHQSEEAFLPYVSDELIRQADLALSHILADHPDDDHGIYLSCDQDGYLCLCAEIIVYFEPEVEGMKGCGFDHDHVFYRERISTQPVK